MPKRSQTAVFTLTFTSILQSIKLIEQKKYKSAYQILHSVLYLNPNYAHILYLYGLTLQNLSNSSPKLCEQFKEKAYSICDDFYAQCNHDPALICSQIWAMYERMKNTLGNVEKLENFSGRDWVEAVGFYLKKKDFDTCYQILLLFQAIQKPKKYYSDEDYSNIGVKCFEMGMYAESINLHEMAVDLSPNDVMYNNNLSILHYIQGNYPQSLAYNKKTQQLQPNRAKSFYVKSFIVQKLGETEQCIKNCKKALSYQPEQPLFQIKDIINQILNNNHPLSNPIQIKNGLNKICNNSVKGIVTKQYFVGDDSLRINLEFVGEKIRQYWAGRIPEYFWKHYIMQIDDFLIKGLRDKLKLRKSLEVLRNQIIEHLDKLDPQQKQKLEEVPPEAQQIPQN